MDKERGLIRAAGSMSIVTMLSRIAGYFRDSLQATILGAANSSDAFVIAYRIPNMLRRLVAEGALTSAFVPTFARYIRSGDREAMWRFAASVLYAMAVLLAIITALGIVFSPLLVKALAWGFMVSPEKLALTISLNRLMFPCIFAISLSTVILPTLSRATADRDAEKVRSLLSTAMRLLLFVTVPATLGLIVLRVPIIHVLFERGRFTREDTFLTASALAYYAIGLLPFAAVNIQATAFYAHRDTRTPVKVAALTFFLHLGLNFLLRGPMKHSGIALSTSISALADSALLAWMLRRRAGEYLDAPVVRSAWHTLIAGAAMGAALLLVGRSVDVLALHGILAKAAALSGLVAGGGAIYFAVLAALGSEELRLLVSVMRPAR